MKDNLGKSYEDKAEKFEQNINYFMIDLTRLIFAVIVMWGHCFIFGSSKLFGLSGLLFNRYLSRICVPFFFACTGYFWSKNNDFIESGKRMIFKFLKFYFFWSVIYTPIHLYNIYFSANKGNAFKEAIITFLTANFSLWWLLGTAQAVFCFLIIYIISKKSKVVPLMIATAIYGYRFITTHIF